MKSRTDLQNNIIVTSIHSATSLSFVCPNLFVKYVIRWHKCHVYEREKYLSTILSKFSWYPKLLYSDDSKKMLVFENVGKVMNYGNMPHDLEIQFNNILNDLKSVNVQHNDIKTGEILINENNKIFLCDFGWGSINNDIGCGINIWGCNNKNKPGGYHCDSNTLKRLGLIKK